MAAAGAETSIPVVTFNEVEEGDLPGMSELCAAQGWGIEDYPHMASVLPSAVWVARSEGKIIGCCFGVPMDDQEAMIGSVAVDQRFRRRGIATELLRRSLAALGDRNVTLNASPSGEPLYRKLGFKTEVVPTYYHYVKFPPKKKGLEDILSDADNTISIVPLSKVDFGDLIAYDTDIHRIKREFWIRLVVDGLPQSVAAVNAENQIVGYVGIYDSATKNQTSEPYHIELKPLLANSLPIAAILLKHVLDLLPEGHLLRVNLKSENPRALSLLKKVGFPDDPKRDTVMFTKRKFEVKAECVYSTINGNNHLA